MDNKEFPYTIKTKYVELNDGICCAKISDNFHSLRCKKKVKKIIDGVGLCGIHANMVEKWRKI